ncbi:hypothetical protein MKX03_022436 [Papaver bracteatum]|nr:hypothetical protein MKX03_022436 [Papaver bracteatum]
MEKLNLARSVCKTVYGLRYRTMTSDEFSKTTDPNLKNTVLSPKEAEHVREVSQYFDKSHTQLAEHYKHFKVFFSLPFHQNYFSPNCLMVSQLL